MVFTSRDQIGPRSFRIAEHLRRAIIDGTLAASSRLPGQRELAHQYDTTLMTIRQALSLLEAEGLVRSEHGVGTFVTSTGLDPDVLQLASFGDTSASPTVTTLLRSFDATVQAPEPAHLLGLALGVPLVRLERLRLLGDAPIMYQQSYLPPALADLGRTFRPDVSLYRQLQDQCGERAVASRETLQSMALSAEEAALLDRSAGAPAFRSCRLTLNLQGQPLVYDEALLPCDR